MTGPEHYKAAEELLGIADERDVNGQLMTALAQAHATLALAAATAEFAAGGLTTTAWHRALTGEES